MVLTDLKSVLFSFISVLMNFNTYASTIRKGVLPKYLQLV